jgi:circadian clock protein KaiB
MRKRPSSPRYKFSVYIAKHTPRADWALERLSKICEEKVPGDYEIEVIDLAKHPDIAKDRQIVATPAVFRALPAPLRKCIGDLSDTDRTLLGLDLFRSLKSHPPRGKNARVPQPAD